MLLYIVCVLVILHVREETSTYAIGTLTTVPEPINGVLRVCPEETVTLTCTHNTTGSVQTRWEISGGKFCIAVHDGSSLPSCRFLNPIMVSDSSSSTLISIVESTTTESMNDTVVQCLGGPLQSSPQIGNVTIKINGPPSVPTIGSTLYSIKSALTGSVTLNASSMSSSGVTISYNANVTGDSGGVTVTDNIITVTGLSYNQTHTLTVTAAVCPGIETNSTTISVSFNTTVSSLSKPVASVVCCNSTLPIHLTWNVDPEITNTTDPNVPLIPPPIATPTISYSSTGERNGSTSSDSPYLLTDTVRNDTYTFTVTVTNVAGVSSTLSNEVSVYAREIDQSTVSSSNCLTVNINQDCLEDVTTGAFSIQLRYAFGICRELHPSAYTTSTATLSAYSTCVPVESGTGEFCYVATFMHQDTVIDTENNLKFFDCTIADLQTFLGAGVSYQLDGVESGGNVSHLTTATLKCDSALLSGADETTCTDGMWRSRELRSCLSTLTIWQLVIIIIIIVVILVLFIGIFLGLLTAHCWPSCIKALENKKLWAISVVLLTFIIGIGFGILLYYCCCRRRDKSKKGSSEKREPETILLESEGDDKAIKHETAPSGAIYTVVDKPKRGSSKKEKPEMAPLGSDGDGKAIEHETAPSGAIYTVVDKPKRGSSKKREPDVVPPGSEGLNYIEVEVTSGHQKPESDAQWQSEDPGCVEYSVVTPETDLQG